jgi:hypothetical protein
MFLTAVCHLSMCLNAFRVIQRRYNNEMLLPMPIQMFETEYRGPPFVFRLFMEKDMFRKLLNSRLTCRLHIKLAKIRSCPRNNLKRLERADKCATLSQTMSGKPKKMRFR